ncbi:MAG TPA: amidohydrolase family protein [Terriglobales bacterium]|nr:amidohydrolase family protein [Terriglobales bacterium]
MPTIFAAAWLVALCSHAGLPHQDIANPLVFNHVTVIDVTGGPVLADRTVVVSGDSIVAVSASGSIEIPKGAQVVDGRGKFLIPGLWDMHTHIAGINANPAWAKDTLIPVLVANGITGIRDMGGDLDALENWRREIESGTLIGPRIVAAGPMLLPARAAGTPAEPIDPSILRIGTLEEARSAVDSLQKRGADFIKIIDVSREVYFAIAGESKRIGIPFAGHIPWEVNATEASNAGQKSIEHIIYSSLALDCSAQEHELRRKITEASAKRNGQAVAEMSDEANRTFSPAKAAVLWGTFKKNGTWVTPTLFSISVNANRLEDSPDDPELAYLPLPLRKEWMPKKSPSQDDRDTAGWWERQFENDRKLTSEMHRAGVRLLAGSDSLDRYDFVGTSLHEELEMLVSAGFTPLEALQTATANPAEYLGEKGAGKISIGNRADLVLLDADPTQDIHNTRKISAVVLRGKLYERNQLSAMTSRARAAAAAVGSRDTNSAK